MVTQEEIVFTGIQEEITDEVKRETLALLENPSAVDTDTREMLDKYFSYEYPFQEDVTLHSKASVTEIKKQSMAYEEEQDGLALYGETIQVNDRDISGRNEAGHPKTSLPEIIPDFAKSKEQLEVGLSGAQRGTAHHRICGLRHD